MIIRAFAGTLSLLLPAAELAAPEAAVARTEQMVAAFKKVKPGVSAAENAPAFAEVDSLIDYGAIVARALEPRTGQLTPSQRADFQKKLHELIRLIAYPDSGDFFRRARITFKPLRIERDQTLVPFVARLPDDDLEVEVTLHWAKRPDGALRVVDVSFDGDSLVQDYQNQFSRIVDREGVPGLFKKLEERRTAVDRGPSKEPAGETVPAAGRGTKSR